MTEDNFAKAPVSIAELKADQAADGRLWKPRDALISLLRDIDSGEQKVDLIFIAHSQYVAEGTTTSFVAAGGNSLEVRGCVARATFLFDHGD